MDSEIPQAESPKPDLGKYPLWAHPVIETHGELVFIIAMRTGIAQQATEELSEILNRHVSRKGLMALQMLGQSYNIIATALATKGGITQEALAECDQAIRVAFETRNEGRILVQSDNILH